MLPTSKKLRGHIGLGPSVRLSVTFALVQEPLEIKLFNNCKIAVMVQLWRIRLIYVITENRAPFYNYTIDKTVNGNFGP